MSSTTVDRVKDQEVRLTSDIAILREKLKTAENRGDGITDLVEKIAKLQNERYELLKAAE